jgi:uncharacterized repeat protein (TIGR02543 family)
MEEKSKKDNLKKTSLFITLTIIITVISGIVISNILLKGKESGSFFAGVADKIAIKYNYNLFDADRYSNKIITGYNQNLQILSLNGKMDVTGVALGKNLKIKVKKDEKYRIYVSYVGGSYETTDGTVPRFVFELQKDGVTNASRVWGTHYVDGALPTAKNKELEKIITITDDNVDTNNFYYWLWQKKSEGTTFNNYRIQVYITKVDERKVKKDGSYGKMPTPKKNGYEFLGWYDSLSGNNKIESTTSISKKYTHTLYAHWKKEPNAYAIKYEGNGSTSGTMSNQTVAKNTKATIVANAYKKDGYVFAGWNTAADGSGTKYESGDIIKKLTSDITLYAQWNAVDNNVVRVGTFNMGYFSCGSKKNKPAGWCSYRKNVVYESQIPKYIAENLFDPANLDIIGVQEARNGTSTDYIQTISNKSNSLNNSYIVKPLNANAILTKMTIKSKQDFGLNIYDDRDGDNVKRSSFKIDSDYTDAKYSQRKIVLETKDYYADIAKTDDEKNQIKYREVNINGKTYYEYNTVCDWSEPRSIQKVVVNINGVDISFYNTHLTTSVKNHKYCKPFMSKKTQEIFKNDPNPIILTGDMNYTNNTYYNDFLKEIGFEIAAYDNSSNNLWGKAAYCDMIYIRPYGVKNGVLDTTRKIDVLSSPEVNDVYGTYSDHNMVITNLSIHQ